MEPTDVSRRTPERAQRRLALGAILLGAAIFCSVLPLADTPVSPAVGVVALYGAGLGVTSLLSALLLAGQWRVRHSLPIGLLAGGYLLSALAAGIYTLIFPGLINLFEVASSGRASDALYLTWHGVLSLCVLGYALADLPRHDGGVRRLGLELALLLAVGLAAVLLLDGGLAQWVPALVAGARLGDPNGAWVAAVLVLSCVALVAVLRKRPQSLLDLWLAVAMVAWLLDIALSASFDTQAFDLGFYAGRLLGLVGSLFVLGVLGAENLGLHARLHATFEEMIEARAREKSNALLAAVLRQLPEGVFIFGGDEHRLVVNERGAALAGNRRPGHELAPDDSAVMRLIGAQASRAARGEAYEDEVVEHVENGVRHVFSVSGAPVRDADGTVAATVVVVNDITERTEADRALRQALGRTRALLENTPMAAVEWGEDRIVRRWSRRAEELFGWSAGEVVGRSLDEVALVHPDDAGMVRATLTSLAEEGATYVRCENRNLTRDGRVLHCEWHNSVLRNERGEIETLFSLCLDVTERRQAMEQLRDADLRKDVFIATLAHELRNPLAPISNAASLLMSQQVAPERIAWMATMIGRQSARMARLLDDLLDVSRISRGKVELRREPTELVALVHEALQTSMPLIEAARHRIELALVERPVWVDADPVRIAQVMSNLMNNSAKYTRPGGHLRVRLDVEDGRALFAVSDDGIGIEPEMLDHVFEPFVQVGGARHLAQGGLGIGLSLSRGLVELHGGTLEVSSAGKDRGATFTMRLPLAARQGGAPGQAGPAAASVGAIDAAILVADDNVDAADSLALLLRARGARVMVAHDGEEALRAFRASPCDVAILDLGMPRVDGLQVARELARAEPRPYLVALTGRGRKEDRAQSLQAGFDEHLTKPVDPQHLAALLLRVRPGARHGQAASHEPLDARLAPRAAGAGRQMEHGAGSGNPSPNGL